MSWGAQGSFIGVNLIWDTISNVETNESKEQFAAAQVAIVDLIESNALGQDREYLVTASGHANPDHAPVEGWANDTISINITQIVRTS